MNTQNYQAEAEERHGLELIEDCFKRLLANSSSPLFNGIRQQLASDRLPNLAQPLDAMASNLRENPNLCFDKEKRAKS